MKLIVFFSAFLSSALSKNIDNFHSNNSPHSSTIRSSAAPLQFKHGTTTLSFLVRVNGKVGVLLAVDSRASMGSFVSSSTVNKVLPVTKNILATMAGGAADCAQWIRQIRSVVGVWELEAGDRNDNGERERERGGGTGVRKVSRVLANALYSSGGGDLSIGTMVCGVDEVDGASIYYVDNMGMRVRGNRFSVGSGATYAIGVLDECCRENGGGGETSFLR